MKTKRRDPWITVLLLVVLLAVLARGVVDFSTQPAQVTSSVLSFISTGCWLLALCLHRNEPKSPGTFFSIGMAGTLGVASMTVVGRWLLAATYVFVTWGVAYTVSREEV